MGKYFKLKEYQIALLNLVLVIGIICMGKADWKRMKVLK